jgi:RNA polymerase sigma-70 factor, ECF subfamily
MLQRSTQLLPAAPAIEDSFAWISALGGPSTHAQDEAVARLHLLLLRAARFALSRRQDQLSDVGVGELEGLAVQAADDALTSILRRLDDFRGASRFTTWASKFAVLEAGVQGRRRAWQSTPADDQSARRALEAHEALPMLSEAMRSLTPHEREIFTALSLNAVPIDVLAERRSTTRGALCKTLHDARRQLRAALVAPTGGRGEAAP